MKHYPPSNHDYDISMGQKFFLSKLQQNNPYPRQICYRVLGLAVVKIQSIYCEVTVCKNFDARSELFWPHYAKPAAFPITKEF